jgi:putative transposase
LQIAGTIYKIVLREAMSQYDYKPEYKRHLPHIQPPGATLFVTIRLAGSIPKVELERLKMEAEEREDAIRQTAVSSQIPSLIYQEQKRQFARWDDLLDCAASGPRWLSQPEGCQNCSGQLTFLGWKCLRPGCFFRDV